MLNVGAIREDFPIIKKGRIYLDSAATSLTPEPVLERMLEYYRNYRANVGRGIYEWTKRATDEFEDSRRKIALLINAKPEEIVFVRNTSEAINLVASGLKMGRGERVLATIQEHHSNYIVWLREKNRRGIDLRVVGSDSEGNLDFGELQRELDAGIRLVSLTHVSNVLGTKNQVKDVCRLAHEAGALVLVDGAQSVPHMKVDVKRMGCDFLAFSGHKMCGPTGIGALYLREDLQDEVEPLCIGGGSIEDVGVDYYLLKGGPARFEAGTPPIADAIGMGAAASYLMGLGMENVELHESRLTRKMLDVLLGIEKIQIYGPTDATKKAGLVSFNLGEMNPHDVALALDRAAGIMVRSGHHCALPLMKQVMGIKNGSVRASVYIYNTEAELELFGDVLAEISKTIA